MKPHRILGFKAVANAGYDCSFSVMYPVDANPTDDQIVNTCKQAIADANRMHGGVNVIGRSERTIMVKD